jgi:hypothetical protein
MKRLRFAAPRRLHRRRQFRLRATMTEPKTALITGVTGQDGAYLAEFLLKKSYEAHGSPTGSTTWPHKATWR